MEHIHPHNTKPQTNDYRPCVLEKKNLIVHIIYGCVLCTLSSLTVAKLQIIKHYLTKPALLGIDYFLQDTFFKHIFLMFPFKVINPSCSPKIRRDNNNDDNNNNELLLVRKTSIY